MQENKGKYLLVVEGAISVGPRWHLLQDRRSDHGRCDARSCRACRRDRCLWLVRQLGRCPGGVSESDRCCRRTAVSQGQDGRGRSPVVPPNPANFIGTVLFFVTYGKLPPIDDKGRPKWAYGRLIHEKLLSPAAFRCRPFRYRVRWTKGHQKGWCFVQARL